MEKAIVSTNFWVQPATSKTSLKMLALKNDELIKKAGEKRDRAAVREAGQLGKKSTASTLVRELQTMVTSSNGEWEVSLKKGGIKQKHVEAVFTASTTATPGGQWRDWIEEVQRLLAWDPVLKTFGRSF